MGSQGQAPASSDGISVLFVCLGNICRSTMAEAVFRHSVANLSSDSRLKFKTIDSAGTAGYHVGEGPWPNTMRTLKSHNIEYAHTARKVRKSDFDEFDYIFAMDGNNYDCLKSLKVGTSGKAVVSKFGDLQEDGTFVEAGTGKNVPDPYGGDDALFEEVYKQVLGYTEAFMKYLDRST